MTDSTAQEKPKASSFRWVVIALAFFITLVNYMDRTALSYAKSSLEAELHINSEQFGAIASAFGIGYMVMTFFGGIFVDKWGARKVWSGAALLWSACTALLGTAAGFNQFFLYRTMLGLAEGPHFPALTRVVADWLPRNERARSTAIGLAAVPLASVIGAPLITTLIVSFGWKAMFMILGSLGIVWAFVWYFIYRDYPESCKFVNDGELEHIREGQLVGRDKSEHDMRAHSFAGGTTTWKFILFNPSLMANNLAFFSFGYLLFFATTWLPAYLQQTYNLHLKEVGIFLIAPWLTAAVLLLNAGWLSDWLYKKTGSLRIARSHMIWSCQLLSALCFIPIMFSPSLELAITMISLGIGLGLMPNAAFYAINTDLAKDRAATSLGVMDTFFAAAGILAPYVTGALEQKTGGFSAAFGVLVVLMVSSVVAVAFFQKPDAEKSVA